jgi:hypothetical protein
VNESNEIPATMDSISVETAAVFAAVVAAAVVAAAGLDMIALR